MKSEVDNVGTQRSSSVEMATLSDITLAPLSSALIPAEHQHLSAPVAPHQTLLQL